MEFFLQLCILLVVSSVHFVMSRCEEKRINIRFMTKEGKSPAQIARSLQDVYGEDALSYLQVRLWHHRF